VAAAASIAAPVEEVKGWLESLLRFGLAGKRRIRSTAAVQVPGPPPYPQTIQDAEHLRLLSVFHYVLAGLNVLFGFFPSIYIFMGSMIISGKFGSSTLAKPDPNGWIFIIMGVLMSLLIWGMAVAFFLTGRWLGARRNWTFCFVIACISCAGFPLGTALGVFTIMVLVRPSVKGLFGKPLSGYYLNR